MTATGMPMHATCPSCGCADPRGAVIHAIAAAVAGDDIDRALELGLLDAAPCPGCAETCALPVLAARDARSAALAARERHRARAARLQRREQERAAARAIPAAPAQDVPKPALPSAAAAALARARARVAERHKP